MAKGRDIWTWILGLGGAALGMFGVFSGIDGFLTGEVAGLPGKSGSVSTINYSGQPAWYWFCVAFWSFGGAFLVGWCLREMRGGGKYSSQSIEEIVRTEEKKSRGNAEEKHQGKKRGQ